MKALHIFACALFSFAAVALVAWGMLSDGLGGLGMIIGFGGAVLCALVAEQFAHASEHPLTGGDDNANIIPNWRMRDR